MAQSRQEKLPHIQFYPGDWWKDSGVQSLDHFHKGVWFEMLLIMFDSSERGRLLLNGRAMSSKELAKLLALDEEVLASAIQVLLDAGVCRQNENGILYNERMIRDEQKRQNKIKAGRAGGIAKHVSKTVSRDSSKTLASPDNDIDNEIDTDPDLCIISYEPPPPPGLTQVTPHCWASSIDIDQWQCSKGKQFLDRCFEKLNGWIEQTRGDPLVFQERRKIGRDGVSGAFQSWVFREIAKEQAEAERTQKPGGGKKTNWERNMEQLAVNVANMEGRKL